MTYVRALAATDFHQDALATAMFEGQVYDVPEDEAQRLVAEGLAEVVSEPESTPKAQGAPPPGQVYDEITKTWTDPQAEEPAGELEEAPEEDEKPKPRRRAK